MRSMMLVIIACLFAQAGANGTLPWETAAPAPAVDSSALRDPLALLLAGDQGLSEKERTAYAKLCEDAVKQYPASSFRAAACKKIGDVYFDLNQLRHANKWHTWYAKAAASQPSLIKETPVGFRLQMFEKYSLRKKLLSGVFLIYGFAALAVILRTFRYRRAFDARSFFRRGALFGIVFAALAAAVFAIDLRVFLKSTNAIAARADIEEPSGILIKPARSLVSPFVPFSIIDPSAPAQAVLVLVLGFLPIVFALFYTSFKRTYSRIFVSVMVLVFCTALWLHFIIAQGFDAYLKPKILATGSRVVFRGEVERMILKNPRKVLRANPGLLESSNEDLEKFIKEHYPEGFHRSVTEPK